MEKSSLPLARPKRSLSPKTAILGLALGACSGEIPPPSRPIESPVSAPKTARTSTNQPVEREQVRETREIVQLPLGETSVRFSLISYGDGPFFFNMHGDETESVTAARPLVERSHGTLLILENPNQRDLSFTLDGTPYQVDPNRVFTQEGARKTLDKLNPAFDKLRRDQQERLVSLVYEFGETIMQRFHLRTQTKIITLHNNADGGNLSIHAFEGRREGKNALTIHINPRQDADDFIYVNNERDFLALKERAYNVVLHNATTQRDDGSLIVACGSRMRYFNVEAQPSHINKQQAMLAVILELPNL